MTRRQQLFDQRLLVPVIVALFFGFGQSVNAFVCDIGILSNIGCFNIGLGNVGFFQAGVGNAGLYNAGVFNAGIMNAGALNWGLVQAGRRQRGLFNKGFIPRAGIFTIFAIPLPA